MTNEYIVLIKNRKKKNEMGEYLEFAKEIAKEAKKIMKKYFNTKLSNGATYKGDKTIVTIADKEINSYLIEKVKEKYPNHSVDGEEEVFGKSDYVWVCDLIDGTAMFARNIPTATFSLALVVNGEPIIGVINDVFTDNLYTGVKGKGAYKNDEKIKVNDYLLEDMRSVGHYDMWPEAPYKIYDVIKELGKKEYFVSIGSVIRACVCVAAGEFNLVIFPGTVHKNCDIAAVKIIVEEAGGKVTDIFGNNQRYDESINGAVVSNGIIHEEVIETIKKFLDKK